MAIVAAVLGVGTLSLQSFRADPTPEPVGLNGKPASKPATLAVKAEKEAWFGEAAGRVKKLEERDAMRDQEVKELREELRRKTDDLQKGLKTGPGSGSGDPKLAGLAPSARPQRSSILPPAADLPVSPTRVSTAVPPYGGPPAGGLPPRPVSPQQAFLPVPMAPTAERIRVISPDPMPTSGDGAPPKYWIPTGSMIPVKLLTGVDAPGKSAAMGADPHPVLMFAENLSMLPNNVRMDMRECFVLGEAIGDLSEERAKIRALSLSCVKKNKTAVDIRLKGVITGEDGKIGMRGPVVQREGAILAKALMAGFVSGISRVFQPYQQGFTISNSPQQAFNFPDPDRIGLAGVAGGLGGAAQTLARHYTQLAKDIYPVIEIDAGRRATLIVTEGRELREAPQP